jgi:hypothetical protein
LGGVDIKRQQYLHGLLELNCIESLGRKKREVVTTGEMENVFYRPGWKRPQSGIRAPQFPRDIFHFRFRLMNDLNWECSFPLEDGFQLISPTTKLDLSLFFTPLKLL